MGDLIMQGLNNGPTKESSKPSSGVNVPITTSLSIGPDANLPVTWNGSEEISFTSKTQRPMLPISWASSFPAIEKCWSDIVTWRSSSISWHNERIAGKLYHRSELSTQTVVWGITEKSWERTIYPSSVSAYTLCDGSARVDERPETRTTTYNSTFLSYSTVPSVSAYPASQPCIPDPHTCRIWYYESNINVTNEDELLQQCGNPTGLYEPCLVGGGPVRLIYWPEETDPSSFCPNNASMVMSHPALVRNTSTMTMPETLTALGQTFTSGSVYLSFHTLYASYDGFYDRVGPTFKDTIIAVPSSAMSTHCGGFTEAHGSATPLNYADLNWPVAASAYSCQARCDQQTIPINNRSATPTECSTIWSDVNPNIAVPSMVKDLVPEWAHCEMSGFRIPNFWFDPPIMLTKEASIALPTTPNVAPTKEPAAPSSGLPSSTPKETGSPQPTGEEHADPSSAALPSRARPHEGRPPATAVDSAKGSVGTALPSSDQGSVASEIKASFAIDDSPDAIPTSAIVGPGNDATETGAAWSGQIDPIDDTPNVAPTSATNPDTEAHGTAGSVISNHPSEPTRFTTRFSYQPLPTSLDALSVLESALSQFPDADTRADDGSAKTLTTSEDALNTEMGGSASTRKHGNDWSSQGAAGNTEAAHTEPPIVTTAAGAQQTKPTEHSKTSNQAGDGTTNLPQGIPDESFASTTAEMSYLGPMPPVVAAPDSETSILTALGVTITASFLAGTSTVAVMGSHTFSAGDPAATINGHTISYASSGLVVISSGTSEALAGTTATSTARSIDLVAGSLTVPAEAADGTSGVVGIGESTLSKEGDAMTLDSGETLRIEPSGVVVVKGDSTVLMSSMSAGATTSATPSSTAPSQPSSAGESPSVPSGQGGSGASKVLHSGLVVGVSMLAILFM